MLHPKRCGCNGRITVALACVEMRMVRMHCLPLFRLKKFVKIY